MAIVNEIRHAPLTRVAEHKETECTDTIVTDDDGKKFLQIDTYGSANREMGGKKSQSIRLTPNAILQLKTILQSELLTCSKKS